MTPRRSAAKKSLPGGEEERDEHFLPPRKAVHPAEKEKWIRIFYRTLLWLFIALVAGLLAWGIYRYTAE